MSNALTVAKLPAHLQALVGNASLSALNADAVKGISSGAWPRISIKGNRFRLQDPQGQEIIVPEHYLDVVLVGVNPHGLSKIWYAGAYDPSKEGEAPDCYSDNGIAPSIRAAKPQCGTCAACPWNVWGSKVTPAGAQVKACADTKKVAVLLANNTSGPVFELRIPAASLGNLGAYIRSLDSNGIPAAAIVTRLTFDTSADYPKLLFAPPMMPEGQTPYITPEMYADVMEVVGSDEVKQCTGELDKPIDPSKVGAAATTLIASQPAPTAPAPTYLPPPSNPVAAAPAPAAEAAPKTRGRRKAAEPAAAATAPQAATVLAAQPVQYGAPAPAAHLPPPPSIPSWLQQPTGRDAQAPVEVQHTNSDMDALLAAAMKP